MLRFVAFCCVVTLTLALPDPSRSKRAAKISREQFLKQNLNCHNKHRKDHGSPPLVYRQDLQTYAQTYANKLAADDNFEHSDGPYGENLFLGYENVDGNSACESWYDEVQLYDYTKDNPPNFADVGHFTQLVWKKTTAMGIGYAYSPRTERTYVVANYAPPGNYRNEYKANVLPPK